eukprot:6925671-Prorocentrum_lima.AAC.1
MGSHGPGNVQDLGGVLHQEGQFLSNINSKYKINCNNQGLLNNKKNRRMRMTKVATPAVAVQPWPDLC